MSFAFFKCAEIKGVCAAQCSKTNLFKGFSLECSCVSYKKSVISIVSSTRFVSCSCVSYKKKRLSVTFHPLGLFFIVVFLIKKKRVTVSIRPLGTSVRTVFATVLSLP